MPKGTPKIGSKSASTILGSITNPSVLNPEPQQAKSQWQSPEGFISMTDAPPPWELADASGPAQSDAKRYVDCPADITLRWINPRVLDAEGWRDWKPVMASDPNIKCKVATMISPEGNIRRGGNGGDILAWMPTSWVISRRKQLALATARQTSNAKAEQEKLFEDFKRGKYGPYTHLDSAKHPSHTMGEGKSMLDN